MDRFGFDRISSLTFLISEIPEDTADNEVKFIFVSSAIILARVVLPVPGGPQNIIDGIVLFLIRLVKILSFPSICSWPIKLSKLFGLILEDNGAD